MVLSNQRAATFAALFLCRIGAALAALMLWVGPASAQDVTLTSRDGLITLTGTMQSYDGAYYRVQTAYGLLTLDGQGVRCDGPGCPNLADYVPDLTIASAAGTARLWTGLIERFAARSGFGLQHVVQSDRAFRLILSDAGNGQVLARLGFALADSDQGLADLQSGKADLALSLQVLAGLPGTAEVIALDAAVPLVAASNPLTAISLPDLAGVLSGRITNWRQLGRVEAPIVLHALMPGSGLLRATEARLGVVTAAAAIRHEDAEQLADAIAADPWAIAVSSMAEVGNARALDLTGACRFPSRATADTVKSGDYPLALPMALYAPDRPLPLVLRDLLDWVGSPDAAPAVRDAGFVDQQPARIALAAQGDRLAHAIAAAGPEVGLDTLQAMVADMADADRLTPTFRFRADGRLDVASEAALGRLARDLEAGLLDGNRLILVGFSDGSGPTEANLRLARQRAERVHQALLAAAPLMDARRVALKVAAYGEALPIACDDTPLGAATNRRVELWVQPLATDSPLPGN